MDYGQKLVMYGLDTTSEVIQVNFTDNSCERTIVRLTSKYSDYYQIYILVIKRNFQDDSTIQSSVKYEHNKQSLENSCFSFLYSMLYLLYIGEHKMETITKYIKIRSGRYLACFTNQEEYHKYSVFKTFLLLFSVFSFLITFLLIIENGFGPWILAAVLFYLLPTIVLKYKLNEIKFKAIRSAILNQGYKITYENETTGTISYKVGKERHSLSVFKGYNSKWLSRYK